MLTAAENELLTRVGPGTPMGGLLRRYWQPVATVHEMVERWTKSVRLLGEDLVLFRDRSGTLGLIGEACPHRRASMAYGIPTADGIRCPYHGWKFDGTGRCLEQPNEPAGSNFKDKVALAGYPVAQRGGLVWAYLGPAPAPLVPPLPGLDDDRAIRMLGAAVIPCNWLQIMENSLDAVHTEWLHGHLFEFVLEKANFKTNFTRRHLKLGFDEFAYGITKRRVVEGRTEADDDWTIGHPVVFPTTLLVGNDNERSRHLRYQVRVPIDDTHTMHYWYHVITPPAEAAVPAHLLDRVHRYDVPYRDEHGEYLLDAIHAQDIMAWITQGPVADRTTEALGVTDKGITLYRALLRRELKKIEAGEDPKNTFRDPAAPRVMDLPLEHQRGQRDQEKGAGAIAIMFERHEARYSGIGAEVIEVFADPPAAVGAR